MKFVQVNGPQLTVTDTDPTAKQPADPWQISGIAALVSALTGAAASPVMVTPPSLSPASVTVGDEVTVSLGTFTGASPVGVLRFLASGATGQGTDVTASIVNGKYKTTAAGTLTLTVTAAPLSPVSVSVTVAAATQTATRPAQFTSSQWSTATGLEPFQIVVNITALPSDGGAAIEELQYDAGAGWTALAGAGTGSRILTMPEAGTAYDVQIRAVNAIDPGPASAAKAVTSGAELVAPILTGGSLSPISSDLLITSPIATGSPTPTVTLALTRDGADVLGEVSNGQIVDAAPGVYSATWTATNGVEPDATVTRTVTIEAEGPVVAPLAFPAQGSVYDLDFAGQQFFGGTQPLSGSSDDGRFFRQMVSQSTPIFSENADGSLAYWSSNTLRITTKGLYVHRTAARSYVLHNRDLSQSVWIATGCTAVKDLSGRDNRGSQASRVTAQVDGATVIQTVSSAGVRRPYLDVKRIAGTGAISMTTDGGVTWEPLDLSDVRFNGWARATLPMRAIADNAGVGFKIDVAGDVFGIDFVQLTDLDYDTSPLQVTSSSARKPYDRPSTGTAESNIGGTQSGLMEFIRDNQVWGVYSDFDIRDPGNVFGLILDVTDSGRIVYNNSNGASLDGGPYRPAPLGNKAIGMNGADGSGRICVNGGPVIYSPTGFGPYTALNHKDLMTNGSGEACGEGLMRRLTIFSTPMTDEEMQLWTAP